MTIGVVDGNGIVGHCYCDATVLGLKAPADVKRFPRGILLILSEGEGVLAGIAQRSPVQDSGTRLKSVHKAQSHCPAKAGVGPIAGAEDAVAGVHLQRVADRTVDYHEDGRGTGGRGGHVYVILFLVQRPQGGGQDGKILRKAAGHHRIGGGGLRGKHSSAHIEGDDLFLAGQAG